MELARLGKALSITCPISKEYLLLKKSTNSLEGEWKMLLIPESPTVWEEDNPATKTCTTHHSAFNVCDNAHLSQAALHQFRIQGMG